MKYMMSCDPCDRLNWWQRILQKIGFYKDRSNVNVSAFIIHKNGVIEHIQNGTGNK
jgi:hypothetical protein